MKNLFDERFKKFMKIFFLAIFQAFVLIGGMATIVWAFSIGFFYGLGVLAVWCIAIMAFDEAYG